MQMFKVVLAAALAVSGVVAKNEWYNCNQCLQKCVQNDEIREYASCDDKKDDFCVFMSEQFHEAMDKCFELHCHHECGDVDKQEVDKPEDCGCGHPECDCLSDNPTGKCGCSNKSMAGKMMSQKRQMMPERDLSLHDRRRDIQHAPVCANLCLAKQIQDQFHLYYMDHRLADSICMDRNFIPTCCAKITENDHTQVAKSIIYVKRFCKHKKNNYLTMTDGLDGAQAREQIEDMLAEIEEKKERRKQNDADDE